MLGVALSIFLVASVANAIGAPVTPTFSGGTGTSSPVGILYGISSTSPLRTVSIGPGLTFSNGLLSNSFTGFSTTSASYFLSQNQGQAFSTSSAFTFLSLNQATAFSTSSADYWHTTKWTWATSSSDYYESTKWRWSTTSEDYYRSVNNFFSTTSATYFISQSQGQSFSTTSANVFLTSFPKGWFYSTTSADFYESTKWRWATSSSDYYESTKWRWSTSSSDYYKSVTNFFSTTSAQYFLGQNQGQGFSTSSAYHFLLQNQGPAFSTSSVTYWESTQAARGGTGSGFSTTSANYWLTQNQGQAFSSSSALYFIGKNQNTAFSTSSSAYWLTLNQGQAFSTTSANYWETLQAPRGSGFSTTSADFWDSTKWRWGTSSSDYYKSVNNFFSTTSADVWLTYKTTDNLPQGSTNKYWSQTLFDNALTATTSLPKITALGALSLPWGQVTGAPSFITGVTADYPLSGSGTSGSHLTMAASSTWYGTGTAGQVLMWSNGNPVWAATSTTGGSGVTQINTTYPIMGGPITTTGTLTFPATSTLYGSGTAGQVLTWSNGVPAWGATSTCIQITGSADLCDGGDATGAGGGVWPFTIDQYNSVTVQSTTTSFWLKNANLYASTTVASKQTIGSSTPWGLVSVHRNYGEAQIPYLVVASSTSLTTSDAQTFFTISTNGRVGLGTTTPYSRLEIVKRYGYNQDPLLTIASSTSATAANAARLFQIAHTGAVTTASSLAITGALSGVTSLGMSGALSGGTTIAHSSTYTQTRTTLATSTRNAYGLLLTNSTAATAALNGQMAPSLLFTGNAWNGTASVTDRWAISAVPWISGFTTSGATSTLAFSWASHNLATSTHLSIDSTGLVYVPGTLVVGSSTRISQGTAPLLSLAGSIAIDTTQDQIKWFGLSTQALNPNKEIVISLAATTTWTGTTTVWIGPTYYDQTWNGVRCETDTGTLNVDFYYGSTHAALLIASTTNNIITWTTNNTPVAGDSRRVDIGTPVSSPNRIACVLSRKDTPK